MAERDQALVRRLQDGDADAPTELVRRYQSKLYSLAYRLTLSHEDAEEVASDALRKAIAKIDRFRGDAALSTWLYSLTFNAAMSRLRYNRVSRRSGPRANIDLARDWSEERQPMPLVDVVSVPDRQFESAELRRAIVAAVRDLSPKYRQAFLLFYGHGLSLRDAAAASGVPIQTTKSRLFRARSAVRASLAEYRPVR